MEFKAVIFDLDGVIVSTDDYHYKAWKQLADEENIYFDETINHQLRGVSRMESLHIILERALKCYSQGEINALAERKNNYYIKLLEALDESAILPGVMAFIAHLQKLKIPIAIGSSSKNAKLILKKIKLSHIFDIIADGTMITSSKPDPEVFLLAAKNLKANPKQIMVIEDAYTGIEAAKRGGFFAVAISDAIKHPKHDLAIYSVEELIKYF